MVFGRKSKDTGGAPAAATVDSWLQDIGAAQHADALKTQGYDDLEFLRTMSAADVEQFAADLRGPAGIPSGHVSRIVARLHELRGDAPAAAATAPVAAPAAAAAPEPAAAATAPAGAVDGTVMLDNSFQSMAPPAPAPGTPGTPQGTPQGGAAETVMGAGFQAATPGASGGETVVVQQFKRFCAVCNSRCGDEVHCNTPSIDLGTQLARPEVGMTVARKFKIEGAISAGGMGEVWRATDMTLQRHVALKTVRTDLGSGDQVRMLVCRFHREAQFAADVDHPNLIKVFEYGQDERTGIIYQALELVDGRGLDEVLSGDGPLGEEQLRWVIAGACDGLQALHDAHILHRDIKPSNMMLVGEMCAPGSYIKVIDLGIAKRVGSSDNPEDADASGVTSDSGVPASLPYTPPERFADDSKTDHRADIFSMGITAFELAKGARPFTGDTLALMNALVNAPLPVAELAHLSQPVVTAVSQACAKHPQQRFQRAADFAAAMRGQQQAAIPMPSAQGAAPGASAVPATPAAGAAQATSALAGKEGWITKKAIKGFMKNWKRRYFVLGEGQLKYFVDQSKATAKGSVVLGAESRVAPAKVKGGAPGFRFHVIDASGSEIALSCDEEADMLAWVGAVNQHIEAIRAVARPQQRAQEAQLQQQRFEQAEAFKTSGNTSVKEGDLDAALSAYDSAISLCPAGQNSHVYFCNRGAVLHQMQRYAEVVQSCEEALKLRPDYSKAYSRMGSAFMAVQQYDDAQMCFERALEADPNNQVAQKSLTDLEHIAEAAEAERDRAEEEQRQWAERRQQEQANLRAQTNFTLNLGGGGGPPNINFPNGQAPAHTGMLPGQRPPPGMGPGPGGPQTGGFFQAVMGPSMMSSWLDSQAQQGQQRRPF